MTRFGKLASASVIALGLATGAQAEMLKINEINVNADLTSVEGANAMDFYPTLTTDLKAALTDKVANLIGESPFRVEVNIHEVSLDGHVALGDDAKFNTLDGFVSVYQDGENVPDEQFPIELHAYTADMQVVPDGALILPASKSEFYAALVDAFATEASEKLAKVDVTGETIKNDR